MKLFMVLPVCILLLSPISSNADGPRFWAPLKYVVEQSPQWACIADFNGDGVGDFAVANSYDGVSIALSNGDGTFEPEIRFGGGFPVMSVCSGDFDEDGDPDLATLTIAPDNFPPDVYPDFMTVYRNAGNGTFSWASSLSLGTYDAPTSACAPDLDNDGDADLVVALKGVHRVRAYISLGTGSFSASSNLVVGTSPTSVWPADFDGDGYADVVVANSGSNNVSILMGVGDGTLSPPVNIAAGTMPSSVCAGDFNEDGDADLAVANSSSNNVSVRMGDGNGGFGGETYFAVNNPRSVCPADLDDDGHQDLAVACGTPKSVCTLLGQGNGTFDPPGCVVGGDIPVSIAAGDLDDDGTVDLATANSGTRSVSVYFNTGIGEFPTPAKYPGGDGPWAIVSTDLDGDGDLDVASTNRYDDNLSIYINVLNGTYASRVNYAAGDESLGLCSGDFDGDGDADLAVANYLSVTDPGTVSVLLNHGDGTFAPRVTYPVLISPNSLCAADLDGDSVDDIAVSNLRSNQVSVLISNGDGTFAAAAHYATGAWPGKVIAADFDGDGDTDLTVGNSNPLGSGGISVLKNAGNGTFSSAAAYGYASPANICSGDFDGDGDIDIAAASNINTLYIYSNIGAGTFSGPVLYSILNNTVAMSSADLDGDSDIDLAIGNTQFDEVLMMVNDGTGVFGKVKYGVSSGGTSGIVGPNGVAPGDVDNDGDVDLVTANFGSDNIAVLFNRQLSATTAVNPPKVATRGALYQNVPNPFNPTTTIRYDIPARSLVTLTIYNVMGQRVRTLVNEVQTPRAGGFAVSWNGRNEAGQSVATGVYFYRLNAGTYSQVRKMVLLK